MSDPDYGIDRPWKDYDDFVPKTPDPTLCEERCENESRCVAWSYVKPHSAKGSNARCYLKDAVSEQKEAAHVVSGTKIKP